MFDSSELKKQKVKPMCVVRWKPNNLAGCRIFVAYAHTEELVLGI